MVATSFLTAGGLVLGPVFLGIALASLAYASYASRRRRIAEASWTRATAAIAEWTVGPGDDPQHFATYRFVAGDREIVGTPRTAPGYDEQPPIEQAAILFDPARPDRFLLDEPEPDGLSPFVLMAIVFGIAGSAALAYGVLG
jgi:hypothetical protein